MNFTIKDATDEDAAGRGYVHYVSWLETYSNLMPPEFLQKTSLERSIAIAKDHPNDVLVAIVNDTVVGYCGYSNISREHISIQNAAEIQGLYVLKAYHRQGIGKSLLNEALARLSGRLVALYVLLGNENAICFYEKAGFHFTGHRYEREVPGGKLTELEMLLEN